MSETSKAWSEMDVFDLKNHVEQGCSLEETADFLMRTEREVREKMEDLGLRAEGKRTA